MTCSTDPGATHYHGCACSEEPHAERLTACEKKLDEWKRMVSTNIMHVHMGELQDKLTSSEIQRSILVEALKGLLAHEVCDCGCENCHGCAIERKTVEVLASQPPNSVAAVLDEVERAIQPVIPTLRQSAELLEDEDEDGECDTVRLMASDLEDALSKLKRLRGGAT